MISSAGGIIIVGHGRQKGQEPETNLSAGLERCQWTCKFNKCVLHKVSMPGKPSRRLIAVFRFVRARLACWWHPVARGLSTRRAGHIRVEFERPTSNSVHHVRLVLFSYPRVYGPKVWRTHTNAVYSFINEPLFLFPFLFLFPLPSCPPPHGRWTRRRIYFVSFLRNRILAAL